MTHQTALDLLQSEDLITLGALAHAKRLALFPENVVTYCIEDRGPSPSPALTPERLTLDPQRPDLNQLDHLRTAVAVTPLCVPGTTAVEYLKWLAVCRLYLAADDNDDDAQPAIHIQLDANWSGLKLAQVALRFGADDFGFISSAPPNAKPGATLPEEEIRRVIRDAGFIPKSRDRFYRVLALA